LKLVLQRKSPINQALPGSLSIDGKFFCYTLERTTVSIASGVYSVEMTDSPEFHRPLPLINGVKGRSALRIHPGNGIDDTKGCILVGNQSNGTTLGDSRAASDSLNERITAALDAGDNVIIEIREQA
jgi:hypothetical protein